MTNPPRPADGARRASRVRRVLGEHRPSILMECGGDEAGLDALRELTGCGYTVRDLDLGDDGEWDTEPQAVHQGVLAGDKSHDVLAWHTSKGEPPAFAAPFEQTRFGR